MTYNKRFAALLLTLLAMLMPAAAALAAGGSGHTYAQDVQVTEVCQTAPAHPAYKPCQRQRDAQVIPCHVDIAIVRPRPVEFTWDSPVAIERSKPTAAISVLRDVDIPPPRLL